MTPELREKIRVLRDAKPPWTPGLAVRCPTMNADGSPIEDDDIRGCGSADVEWDGELYDCIACGIYFHDFAADPPHRRERTIDA